MDDQGIFSGGIDNVVAWLRVAGMVLAVAAMVLLGVALYRGSVWRFTPSGRWLLLVGLLLLPSTTLLLGNTVGFQNVKQSCASCHTMDPWVRDMLDPASESMAALHYKNRWINENQCYTCHTGYGLAGNVGAKWSGVLHVWHHYVAGVPEQIRIHQPYSMDTCLHCHRATAGFLAEPAHTDAKVSAQIMAGEISCFQCHTAPHPRSKG